jgi:hypothetical protein
MLGKDGLPDILTSIRYFMGRKYNPIMALENIWGKLLPLVKIVK